MEDDFYNSSHATISWPTIAGTNSLGARHISIELNTRKDNIRHAIGTIISTNNLIEQTIDMIILDTVYQINGLSSFLMSKQNNSQKRELVKLVAQHFHESDNEVHLAVSEFLKQANICLNNRNFVAHAALTDDMTVPPKFYKRSTTKPDIVHRRVASLNGLREIAQSSRHVYLYGNRIWSLFMGQTLESIPEKPEQPRQWDVILPDANPQNS